MFQKPMKQKPIPMLLRLIHSNLFWMIYTDQPLKNSMCYFDLFTAIFFCMIYTDQPLKKLKKASSNVQIGKKQHLHESLMYAVKQCFKHLTSLVSNTSNFSFIC